MKHDHVLGSRRKRHGCALGVRARVAAGGKDDSGGRFGREADWEGSEGGGGAGGHELGEVGEEEGKDGLGLWVAEADIVFEDFGAARGHHQAGEEAADEGVAWEVGDKVRRVQVGEEWEEDYET